MAIKSGFFNSVNGDRKYDARRFAEYFASFIGNGVFPNPSTNLQVIANNDMTVTIKEGKAWINGFILVNDNDYILEIGPADGLLSRIDRVVLRYDVVDREIRLEVKRGAFTSSPVAQTLQRDADAYELGIADIRVNAGSISITQANITDLRLNTEFCGIVHGTVDQVDLTTLYNQYTDGFKLKQQEFEQEFNTWFQTLQDVLDENTAASLLNMINSNTDAINTISQVTNQAISNTNQVVNTHLADYTLQVPYGVDSGTANAKVVALNPPLTAYTEGIALSFKNNLANTTATSININGLGAKSIRDSKGNTLTAGKLTAGSIYTLRYNGTNFILQGEGGSGNALASDLLTGKTASTDAGDITGTMPNRTGHVIGQSTTRSGTTLRIQPQEGYYSGISTNSVAFTDANFIASNIISGASIFGLSGSYVGKRIASGTVNSSDDSRMFTGDSGTFITSKYITVSGLTFIPRYIIATLPDIPVLSSPAVQVIARNDMDLTTNGGRIYTTWGGTYYRITGEAYMIQGGFRIPVSYNNAIRTFYWVAIE